MHRKNNCNARKRRRDLQNKSHNMKLTFGLALPLLALLIPLTLTGCDVFSKPAGNPPLAADLKEFKPFPESTGDKGRDAIRYASALAEERELRIGTFEAYCRNADPC